METPKTHHSLARILEATAKAAGVDNLAITKKNPGALAAIFKHSGMYIAKEHGHSLNKIATAFGMKSHHGAMYAVHAVLEHRTDAKYVEAARLIMKELYG